MSTPLSPSTTAEHEPEAPVRPQDSEAVQPSYYPPASTPIPEPNGGVVLSTPASKETREEAETDTGKGIYELAHLTPAAIKAMPEAERTELCEKFVTALQTATSVDARVRFLARVTDMYLVDTAIGALLPVAGDIATSAGCAGYLYWEAQNMELTNEEIVKIMGLQVADAAIGLIPGVDLATDTAFPANVLSARYFTAQLDKLITNALVAGVSQEVIDQMKADAELLIQRIDVIYKLYLWMKGDQKKLPGNGDQPKLPDPTKK